MYRGLVACPPSPLSLVVYGSSYPGENGARNLSGFGKRLQSTVCLTGRPRALFADRRYGFSILGGGLSVWRSVAMGVRLASVLR